MTGVRSSCEASATNCRSRASDADRSSNASSMRVSIVLSASPSSPASVPSCPTGTRCERSPAAIAVAVAVICFTGRTPRRITHQVTSPRRPSTSPVMITSTQMSRLTEASTSASESAATYVSPSAAAAGEDSIPGVRRRIGADRERFLRAIAGAVDGLIDVDGRTPARRRRRRTASCRRPPGRSRRRRRRATCSGSRDAHPGHPSRRAVCRAVEPSALDRGLGCDQLRVDPLDQVRLGGPRDDDGGHHEHEPTTAMPTSSRARRDIVGRQLARSV